MNCSPVTEYMIQRFGVWSTGPFLHYFPFVLCSDPQLLPSGLLPIYGPISSAQMYLDKYESAHVTFYYIAFKALSSEFLIHNFLKM